MDDKNISIDKSFTILYHHNIFSRLHGFNYNLFISKAFNDRYCHRNLAKHYLSSGKLISCQHVVIFTTFNCQYSSYFEKHCFCYFLLKVSYY